MIGAASFVCLCVCLSVLEHVYAKTTKLKLVERWSTGKRRSYLISVQRSIIFCKCRNRTLALALALVAHPMHITYLWCSAGLQSRTSFMFSTCTDCCPCQKVGTRIEPQHVWAHSCYLWLRNYDKMLQESHQWFADKAHRWSPPWLSSHRNNQNICYISFSFQIYRNVGFSLVVHLQYVSQYR